MDEAMAKTSSMLEHDTYRISCDTRLEAKGAGYDHLGSLGCLRRASEAFHTAQTLRSFGTPWLLTYDIAAARQLPRHLPAPRFGHCLSVQRGDMVASVIPASPLIHYGFTMHDCVTFPDRVPTQDI
jgi:hypothetical protein